MMEVKKAPGVAQVGYVPPTTKEKLEMIGESIGVLIGIFEFVYIYYENQYGTKYWARVVGPLDVLSTNKEGREHLISIHCSKKLPTKEWAKRIFYVNKIYEVRASRYSLDKELDVMHEK